MTEFTIDQAASADMSLYVRLGFTPCEPFTDKPIEHTDHFSISL